MDTSTKQQALRRILIAKGHLAKIQKMVENQAYCPDVVHQSQAVQAALRKIDELVLEGHLKSCVLGEIESSKREKLTQELLDLFKKQK